MGGSALMSLGTRAMTANYAALQATGHNISNANVEGYSRQSVLLSTKQGGFSGAGYFGKGVEVRSVVRSHDEFLTREAIGAKSTAKADEARLKHLELMERVFPTGENGVGHAAGQLLNAMSDLASRPSDTATRQVVLARAADVAARFSSAGSQLDALQGGVTEELKANVAHLNELAAQVAMVNDRVAAARGLGQPPNDLLDQRDLLISQISGYLQVSTVDAEDGTVAVFIAGGQRLVLGSKAEEMTVRPDTEDSSRMALAIKEGAGVRMIDSRALGAGSMAGLMRFQNEDLVNGRTLLGQMAAAFAGRLNEQQSLGLDMSDPPGAGATLFSVGGPQALPAGSNAVNGSGAYIGSVTLSTVDATQLKASEYEMVADPGGAAGVWQLTRRSDGLVRNVSSGDVVDGFRITLSSPAPAVTDRFLLQPVTRAANGMSRLLDDTRGLAAAMAVSASVGAANSGTASVGALQVVSTSINPALTASISFTNNSGAYNWQLRDASNTLVSSGSATWSAGAPIALNGFELSLNGVPKSGDTLTVAKTQFPAQNNGNALAFLSLRDEAFVGRSMLSTSSLGGGATITDAYASAMGSVGVSVQGARTASTMSDSLAGQAEDARAARSGVNLDEEAARLIQFQQSYQAAAKMLQVAQSVFDTLLDVARG